LGGKRGAAALFLFCLAVYHLNGRPHPEVDCAAAPYVAWSLVRHGSLDLSAYNELSTYRGTELKEVDGRWLSIRPIGSALAAVPVVAPLAAVSATPPRMAVMLQLGKLTAAAWVAAAAVLFFHLCRRLAPAAAVPATVLFAFGTCLWSVASQSLWMHGPATFWVCAALSLLVPAGGQANDYWRAALAGLCLGLAVLTRPQVAFFGLATGGLWLLQGRWRGLLALAGGAAVPLAFHVGLNLCLWGDPIRGGYVFSDWGTPPPLWVGLRGLLVAPSRGLFVYSPALLLLPFGLVALRRDPARGKGSKPLLIAWVAAVALTILLLARWHDWRGGCCFGPRYLCEAMPVLCLVWALGYDSLRRPWGRQLARVLVALSVAVHLVGVFGHRAYPAWQQRHGYENNNRSLFALRDTQIEAHARSVIDQVRHLATRH
jgi:hypothetical protein